MSYFSQKRLNGRMSDDNTHVLQIPEAFASIYLPNSETHKRKRFYVRYGGRS